MKQTKKQSHEINQKKQTNETKTKNMKKNKTNTHETNEKQTKGNKTNTWIKQMV